MLYVSAIPNSTMQEIVKKLYQPNNTRTIYFDSLDADFCH